MESEFTNIQSTAYHEAGHAVMFFLLDIPIDKVSIIPDSDYLGIVETKPQFDEDDVYAISNNDWRIQKKIESQVMGFLAGQIAQTMNLGIAPEEITFDDRNALALLRHLASSEEELEAYYNWLFTKTKMLILADENWPLVEAVANELLLHKRLSGRKTKKIIQQTAMNRIAQELGYMPEFTHKDHKIDVTKKPFARKHDST